MNKMKKFITKHGKKVALTLAIGGLASFSFINQGFPVVNEVYASNIVAKEGVFTIDTVFESKEYNPDIPSDQRKRVEGVEIEVYNVDTNKLVSRGTTGKDGRYTVKNLPEGHYKWTRTKTPDRYNPLTEDKTVNGPQRYINFTIHPSDKVGDNPKLIGANLDVKLSIVEQEQWEDFINSQKPNPTPPVVKPPVDTPPVVRPPATVKPPVAVKPPVTPPVKGDEVVVSPPVKGEVVTPPIKEEETPTESPDKTTESEKNPNVGKDDVDVGGNVDKDKEDETVITPPLTDEKGNLVDKDGHLVDIDGNLIDENGEIINKDGALVVGKTDKDNKDNKDKKDDNDGAAKSSDRASESKVEKGQALSDDVQTYDKGVMGFILVAISGLAGLVLLNRKKNRV